MQGAYTLSTLNDRDQFNMAIKASAAVVNNSVIPVFKDPATDHGKKSVKGFLSVQKLEPSKDYKVISDLTSFDTSSDNRLDSVYSDGLGIIHSPSYDEIKSRLQS